MAVAFLGIPGLSSAPNSKTAPEPAAAKSKAVLTARDIRSKLAQPCSLDKGIDGGTPLKDALEFISDRTEVPILVDQSSFKSAGGEEVGNVEEMPVRLPRMHNVRLGAVLRLLLKQVNANYLVRPDYIEITSWQRSRPDLAPADGSEGSTPFLPLVSIELDRRPLNEALHELADTTDVSIVVDARVEKDAKVPVTATFKNVPLDTAVRVLADMGTLGLVRMDNVLYVTAKPNAENLATEQHKFRARGDAQPGLLAAP